MYKGEISVVEEQLSSLIKAAESLQVRGLSHPDQVPASGRGNASHRSQSLPQVCLEKFPHYPAAGSYLKDDPQSPHNGPGAASPYSPSDRDMSLSSPLRLPTIPHMPHISFTDNPPTPSGDHFCSSPLPRRKQVSCEARGNRARIQAGGGRY
jgi:hypothetical protein